MTTLNKLIREKKKSLGGKQEKIRENGDRQEHSKKEKGYHKLKGAQVFDDIVKGVHLKTFKNHLYTLFFPMLKF